MSINLVRRSRLSFLVCAVMALTSVAAGAPSAQALLTGGQDIIPAPASVRDSSGGLPPGASNTHQQGFNERQGVFLAAPLAVDTGVITAGTVVDSHMIFLNVPDNSPGTTDFDVTWTFARPILGVMSDTNGSLEAASSPILGAPGTSYPPAFPARGLDLAPGDPNRGAGGVSSEGYTVLGNAITVGMTVSQPGDWIRVVTLGNRPPNCLGVTAGSATLWPPNHRLRPVTLSGLTDPDGDPTALIITGVSQDEPVNDSGDGNTAPDAAPGPSADQVQLRAERSGNGDGRVYTVAFTGMDSSGATCTGTVTISVPHDRARSALNSAPPSYDSFGS